MVSQTSSIERQSPWLANLPTEIVLVISSFLTNRDRKSLRSSCRALNKVTPLFFSRVFLSTNPLDIEVFCAVAIHHTFRHQVTEIIWDDARFLPEPVIPEEEWRPYMDREDLEMNPDEECPNWFVEGCEENIDLLRRRKGDDVDRPDHIARQKQIDAQMPLRQCWELYSKLLKDQNEVIDSKADEKAFILGLQQFPHLRRVTVTPAAHGWLFAPLYETPMIRAFPYGFNYPIPRGWPTVDFREAAQDPVPWSEATEEYKDQWRGVRIALRILSQHDHRVSELSFDSKQLITGINFMIFAQPCEECEHFTAIMKRPAFKHLDLPLLVGHQGYGGWEGLNSGKLYQALSEAKELTYISFSTSVLEGPIPDVPPLKKIFPVEHWPALCHFGLSHFCVVQTDLMELLKSFPNTLRCVELSFLHFADAGLGWREFLDKMRQELDWSERDPHVRPNVLSIMEGYNPPFVGQGVWLEDETTNFLYGSGQNPMVENAPYSPEFGYGMLRDLFEPEYTRPNLDHTRLSEMGITVRLW
ncbi:hypothetical protein N7532_010549 [Penicillium argentinense]|uniref:F-box domain-containing protein n=1 Tax=Penicillium argentinense TaxID=1131581 RepID=A0A9W9EPT0_9EURO|nr:uncharacterized protein N7532_010549 [Penicillium argentinense]KAJ5085778.1 hypothetical protein N7532_010549 [Penicillium argentinense]